jgi:hypothetical protein
MRPPELGCSAGTVRGRSRSNSSAPSTPGSLLHVQRARARRRRYGLPRAATAGNLSGAPAAATDGDASGQRQSKDHVGRSVSERSAPG